MGRGKRFLIANWRKVGIIGEVFVLFRRKRMKNFLILAFVFGLGVGCALMGGSLVKKAEAYGGSCDCSYRDFEREVEREIEYKLDRVISSFDFDFKRAVEDVVEDCRVDKYGRISCF